MSGEDKQPGMHKHNGKLSYYYRLRHIFVLNDSCMLNHKHNVTTDLETPVVWLLLRGETKSKRDRKGTGRIKEGKRDRV